MQKTPAPPWYHPSAVISAKNFEPHQGSPPLTPKEIFQYLDSRIYKQDAAKKAAALFAWKTLKGIKENAFFIGPSGCGKTEIFRALSEWEYFVDRISIVDASNLTLSGWKGDKKVESLFDDPVISSGKQVILVLDEIDKALTPKVSSAGDDYAKHLQGELLKPLEGSFLTFERNNSSFQVDTSHVNFALLGAFSTKASEIAESNRGSTIGFNAAPESVQAYSEPFTQQDLLDFGVMPEFLGRVQRLVNLEPMSQDDYISMLSERDFSLVERFKSLYGINLHLTPQTRLKIAQNASESNLGIRGMQNIIQNMIDDYLFNDCTQTEIEF